MRKRALSEATGILAILGGLFIVSIVFVPWLAVLWALLIAFSLYFFRDPERTPPNDPSLAVAPADGHVVAIDEREEGEVIKERMLCISIFLSVFDVHVNRSPIAGRVTHSEGRTGEYLDARDPESSTRNACRLWIIENGALRVAVRQITGAAARRICPWSEVGDELAQGERFGMIRFGSRTELFVPLGSKPLVKIGEMVHGGATAVAALPASAEEIGKPAVG